MRNEVINCPVRQVPDASVGDVIIVYSFKVVIPIVCTFFHILDQLGEQREINWAIWISLSSSFMSPNSFEDLGG